MRLRRAVIVSALAIAGAAVPAQAAMVPYTVRWGNTLTGIARAHHVNVLRLAALNHLDPYGILLAGTVLHIPSQHHPARHRRPRVHHPRDPRHHRRAHASGRTRVVVVRPGQTLWSIAIAAGTTPRALAALNHRRVDAILPVGLHLRVPHRSPTHHRAHHPAPSRHTANARVAALLRHWALRFHLDPRLVMAIAWQESGWRPGLRSSTGAVGLMQVMPGTWSYVEWVLLHRPVAHTESGDVRVGVAYLAQLLRDFRGNVRLAVASYYQGEGSVRADGLMAFTRIYVADVLALRGRM
ncbi:MAG TPA: LysM peptidoglycan-binding domain-containing protein [Thermoleophilia bacterium]|nr:LysM peptidoglycan-binding domain-containing protein [Thermoleophilia bacterium]